MNWFYDQIKRKKHVELKHRINTINIQIPFQSQPNIKARIRPVVYQSFLAQVFASIHYKDTFLWNSIIKAHFSNGNYPEACYFFFLMLLLLVRISFGLTMARTFMGWLQNSNFFMRTMQVGLPLCICTPNVVKRGMRIICLMKCL